MIWISEISNRGDIDLFQVAHGADVDFTLEYQGEKMYVDYTETSD